MWRVTGIAMLAWVGAAAPALAQSSPDLVGSWACDPAPMVIRDTWTTLTYTFKIADQRDALFTGEMHWSLPQDKGAAGNQGGESSFSGTIKVLGVIDWDGVSIDMVAYGDGHRHHGTLVDANTIRFVHSETGDNAWVSRSVCRRQPS
jgi:hypothetical protein